MSGKGKSPTIEALVADITPFLEEFEGRVMSVSEMEVTRTNTPKFPVAMFALQDITFNHAEKGNKPPEAVETIIGEFWFSSRKKVVTKNKEEPFWDFYNYEPLLQAVVDFIMGWRSPRNSRLKMVRMDLESDELAVMISFTFTHTYDLCPTPEDPLGEAKIVSRISIPTGCEP